LTFENRFIIIKKTLTYKDYERDSSLHTKVTKASSGRWKLNTSMMHMNITLESQLED